MRRALLLWLWVLAAPAWAGNYSAAAGSTLGFSASYQDEPFSGRFSRFTSDIRFDPARLSDSRFDVRIQLASANTANAERDELLLGEEFFDAGAQPQARYRASRFRALGGNRFVAEGHLTLRGIRKPVALTFAWTPGAKPVLAGKATLKRLDFQVGTGEWTDTELLPDAVVVTTRLVLVPVVPPAKK